MRTGPSFEFRRDAPVSLHWTTKALEVTCVALNTQ